MDTNVRERLRGMLDRAREAAMGGGAPELVKLLGGSPGGLDMIRDGVPHIEYVVTVDDLSPGEVDTVAQILLDFYGRADPDGLLLHSRLPELASDLLYMESLLMWRSRLHSWVAEPQTKFAELAKVDRFIRESYLRFRERLQRLRARMSTRLLLTRSAPAPAPTPTKTRMDPREVVTLCCLASFAHDREARPPGLRACALSFSPPAAFDWRKQRLADLQGVNRRQAEHFHLVRREKEDRRRAARETEKDVLAQRAAEARLAREDKRNARAQKKVQRRIVLLEQQQRAAANGGEADMDMDIDLAEELEEDKGPTVRDTPNRSVLLLLRALSVTYADGGVGLTCAVL